MQIERVGSGRINGYSQTDVTHLCVYGRASDPDTAPLRDEGAIVIDATHPPPSCGAD